MLTQFTKRQVELLAQQLSESVYSTISMSDMELNLLTSELQLYGICLTKTTWSQDCGFCLKPVSRLQSHQEPSTDAG